MKRTSTHAVELLPREGEPKRAKARSPQQEDDDENISGDDADYHHVETATEPGP